MRFFLPFNLGLYLMFLALLSACSPSAPASPMPVTPLNPASPTPGLLLAPTPTSLGLALITPTRPAAPTVSIVPSPTPFIYTIKTGDTLSQVALRYGLSVDELLAANPGINPQVLSIGQTLQIPSRPASLVESLPAPAELLTGPAACYPSGAGMWCILPLENPHRQPVENITAQFSLFDEQAALLEQREALIPLNILPAGARLPLAAFFPQRPREKFALRVDFSTAFLLSATDPRYLPVETNNLLVQISADGLSARASGRLSPAPGSGPFNEIWLAAVAYSADGRMIGFRRWQAASPVTTFSLEVYSLDGPIAFVEVVVEARP
jgi:LysM repeat protein